MNKRHLILFAVVFCLLNFSAQAADSIKIGVLAKNGPANALKK